MALIMVPENFEELPRELAPICIEDRDARGKPINPQWIDRGVRPIHPALCRMTTRILQDVRYVSEVANNALQRLVARHGDNLGKEPAKQVYARAEWEAKELRHCRRQRRGLEPSLDDQHWLDHLDARLRAARFDVDGYIRDPRDYPRMYQVQLDLDALCNTATDVEIRRIVSLFLQNWTMDEIGAMLHRKPNTLWRKLDRWLRSLRPGFDDANL